MQAKIDLGEHCFYDLVPQHFLLDFYELKNEMIKIDDKKFFNSLKSTRFSNLKNKENICWILKIWF